MITYLGQAKGPFKAEVDVANIIFKTPGNENISFFFKVGIFTRPHHKVRINGVLMEIGKTGMLEVRDTNVTSIVFEQDEDLNSYIDYMAEK